MELWRRPDRHGRARPDFDEARQSPLSDVRRVFPRRRAWRSDPRGRLHGHFRAANRFGFLLQRRFPIVIGAAFSPLIYFGIKLWTMSIAFYNRRSLSIMSGVYNIKEYGKYPASIYHTGRGVGEVVYNVLLFILPFGLIGYLPLAAQMFPGQEIPFLWFSLPTNNYLIMGVIVFVSLFQFVLAYLFFTHALKHYASAGA